MKQIIAMLLVLTSFLWMFGCSKQTESPVHNESVPKQDEADVGKNPYLVRISGVSASSSSNSYNMEFTLWNGTYKDDVMPKEIELVVFDTIYKAEYRYTTVRMHSDYPVSMYVCESGQFFVNADGQVEVFLVDVSHVNDLDQALSEEQCLQIAQNYFATKVEHIEPYTITSSYSDQYKEYTFYFTKYMDDWKTADRIRIWVDPEKGVITRAHQSMLERIDPNAEISFDKVLVEEAVMARVNELLASDNYDRVEYEEMEYILTMISPTEYAVVCKASMQCFRGDVRYSRYFQFVVTE